MVIEVYTRIDEVKVSSVNYEQWNGRRLDGIPTGIPSSPMALGMVVST